MLPRDCVCVLMVFAVCLFDCVFGMLLVVVCRSLVICVCGLFVWSVVCLCLFVCLFVCVCLFGCLAVCFVVFGLTVYVRVC